MSRLFHISESLLASIDGELCRLLKAIHPRRSEKSQFDIIWIPHLKTLAELAKMHMDIMRNCSEFLINMTDFDNMCKTIDTIGSGLGIPELKRLLDAKGLSAMHSSKVLADYFAKASGVWKKTESLKIMPYNDTDAYQSFKQMLNNFVTQRIGVCDRVINHIKWYIDTLQILFHNFESLDEEKQTRIVENILKPGCKIFRIPETSTLDQLIERATELLRIKEHPEPFSPDIAIAVTNMIREGESAKRRTAVHEMMLHSKPPVYPSNFQTRYRQKSPDSWAHYTPSMSYGEAVAKADLEENAATKIQRMHRIKTQKYIKKGGKDKGKRVKSIRSRQKRNA
jgi:hypothetical protein